MTSNIFAKPNTKIKIGVGAAMFSSNLESDVSLLRRNLLLKMKQDRPGRIFMEAWSKESKEIRKRLNEIDENNFNPENDKDIFNSIIEYLNNPKNKFKKTHEDIMEAAVNFLSKHFDTILEIEKDNKNECCSTIIALLKNGYHRHERNVLLAKCYEQINDYKNARINYINASETTEDKNKKLLYLNKSHECSSNLIHWPKGVKKLQSQITQGKIKTSLKLIPQSSKKAMENWMDYTMPTGEEYVTGLFALPLTLAAGFGGCIHGLFRATTQRPLSKQDQKTMIENLHHFFRLDASDEKVRNSIDACIDEIIQRYSHFNLFLAQSNSSKKLFEVLKNPNELFENKIQKLGEFMLAIDKEGELKNNGKKLFKTIALVVGKRIAGMADIHSEIEKEHAITLSK